MKSAEEKLTEVWHAVSSEIYAKVRDKTTSTGGAQQPASEEPKAEKKQGDVVDADAGERQGGQQAELFHFSRSSLPWKTGPVEYYIAVPPLPRFFKLRQNPDAAVEFGTGANPFEHMTVTHWSGD